MFQLVRDYDSRWYIVHDRYEWENGPKRSMEVRFSLYAFIRRYLTMHRISKTAIIAFAVNWSGIDPGLEM